MASKDKYPPEIKTENYSEIETVPFENAEEAWFWFIQAQEARNDGARFVAGQGLYPRPCEPIDILKVLDRLYRNRRLLRDHLLVLRHYGRRQIPPDEHRAKEARAYKIWMEALERLSTVLERKGIVKAQSPAAHEEWRADSSIFEGAAAE